MNGQPDLFTPLARTDDPETSHDAARSMQKDAQSQRNRIVSALYFWGAMNHWELDNFLHWPHPTAARRMKELVQSGRVIKTTRTSATGSGRQATVYKAMQGNVVG